jgi:hypothetical protein
VQIKADAVKKSVELYFLGENHEGGSGDNQQRGDIHTQMLQKDGMLKLKLLERVAFYHHFIDQIRERCELIFRGRGYRAGQTQSGQQHSQSTLHAVQPCKNADFLVTMDDIQEIQHKMRRVATSNKNKILNTLKKRRRMRFEDFHNVNPPFQTADEHGPQLTVREAANLENRIARRQIHVMLRKTVNYILKRILPDAPPFVTLSCDVCS